MSALDAAAIAKLRAMCEPGPGANTDRAFGALVALPLVLDEVERLRAEVAELREAADLCDVCGIVHEHREPYNGPPLTIADVPASDSPMPGQTVTVALVYGDALHHSRSAVTEPPPAGVESAAVPRLAHDAQAGDADETTSNALSAVPQLIHRCEDDKNAEAARLAPDGSTSSTPRRQE